MRIALKPIPPVGKSFGFMRRGGASGAGALPLTGHGRKDAMLSNLELWQRLQDFELDGEGDEFPFSHRLARENAWSREQARNVIEEYKKFIYLLCVSSSPLTPSEPVDQAWHLHLVYTRSYWIDFCVGVLRRQIHHEPTRGGAAQAHLFVDQYAATCSRYEQEFGCAPPAEFWPPVSERFAAAPSLQWIDRRRHWIVPKPTRLGRIIWCGAAVPIVFLANCAGLEAEDQTSVSGGSSFAPILVFAVVAALGWFISRGLRRARKDEADTDSSNSGTWWNLGCGGDGGCGGGGCGGCGG